MSGFKARPSRQSAGFPARLLSVVFYRAESRRLSNSMAEYRPLKPEAAGSIPASRRSLLPDFARFQSRISGGNGKESRLNAHVC